MKIFQDPLDLGQLYRAYIQDVDDFTVWLAKKINLPSDAQLFITCGATGALDLTLSTFSSGFTLATMPYEYFDMVRMAKQCGATVLRSPLVQKNNDVESFIRFLREQKPDGCYISNPNNPLGQEYSEIEIQKILEVMQGRTVIIDQTLMSTSVLPFEWFTKYTKKTRVCLVNSFSKSHGLVAERIGYGVFINMRIDASRFAHAPSGRSIQLARRSWDSVFLEKTLCRVLKNNTLISEWARNHEGYSWQESKTNFGVLNVQNSDVNRLSNALKRKGIYLKTNRELECSGTFLRLDLTASYATIKNILKILSR